MKKKLVVLMMASMLVLSACGSKETAQTTVATEVTTEESTSTEETTETDETDESSTDVDADELAAVSELINSISVDKSGDPVKITYPATMFAGLTKEQIEAAIEADGAGSVTVNEDGSVLVEVSKDDYQTMLDEARDAMQTQLDQITVSLPSVQEISFNDDCTEFTVLCDGEAYNETDAKTISMGLGVVAQTYQTLNGVAADEVYYILDMIDGQTDEVLFHVDSRE